jgi:ferredoxin
MFEWRYCGMHIDIDLDRCMGAGECVRAASEVFGQSEAKGLVEILDPDPPERLQKAVLLAEVMCPTRTISVRTTG